jgi:hypothetical protein
MDGARARAGVFAALFASAILLLLSPLAIGNDYSVLSHTTSEAAAQATPGAWVARSGFLLFGLSVVGLSIVQRKWSSTARWIHRAFGVLMVAAAVYSHRPFVEGVAFDQVEDALHSVAATGMGFAFAAGVLVVGWSRIPRWRVFDMIALAAALLIPLGMAVIGDWAGLLQRVMFAIAYIWYGMETVSRAAVTTF